MLVCYCIHNEFFYRWKLFQLVVEKRTKIIRIPNLNVYGEFISCTLHICTNTYHGLSQNPVRVSATPEFSTSGFCAETHMGMTVTFHVLLPVNLWDYGKRKSQVCVCLGHERLGAWKKVYEMTCKG